MKKSITYILLILIAAGLTYFLLEEKKSNKDLKAEVEKYQKVIDSANLDSAKKDVLIVKLQDSVKITEAKIVEVEETEAEFKNTAKKYKELYKKLLLEKPITVADSLENCQKVVEVVLNENVALEGVIQACDSVKALQAHVIEDLKEVIVLKDGIIDNKDVVISSMDKQIDAYKQKIKNQRKEKIKTGLFGVGIGGAIVFLLML